MVSFSRLISLGVCLATGVLGLQADEQTHIHDALENPVVPNEEFLWRLLRPRTLIVFENVEYQNKYGSLKRWLEDEGHRIREVVGPEQQISLSDDHGNWLQDNVFIIGSGLPIEKSSSFRQKLLQFVDSPWLLPDAYGKKRDESLLLPPGVVLIADPQCTNGTCEGVAKDIGRLAKQLGFGISTKRQIQQASGVKFYDSAFANGSAIDGLPHEFTTTNTQIHSILSPSEDPESTGHSYLSMYQGDRYWTRVLVSTTGEFCSDDERMSNPSLCNEAVNWVTHRRDVRTWTNAQHYKIHGPRTWEEYDYDAPPIVPEWTLTGLKALELSRPYLYRIRDEILFALDLYEIKLDPQTKEFKWVPYQKPNSVQGTYFMMVPYNEEILIPYVHSEDAKSPLMKAWRKHEGKFDQPLKLNSASHWIHYKAPVQHGIHKMIVRSLPSFATSVWMETVMPLRTYKHDEGPQTFSEGWPYYTPWIATVVGFVALLILWPWMKAGDDEIAMKKEDTAGSIPRQLSKKAQQAELEKEISELMPPAKTDPKSKVTQRKK